MKVRGWGVGDSQGACQRAAGEWDAGQWDAGKWDAGKLDFEALGMRNGEIRKRRIRTIALCGTLAQVLTATVAAAQKRMCKRTKRQQSFKHYTAPRELASQPARFEGQPARPKGSPFTPEGQTSKCKGQPSRPKGQPACLNSQSVTYGR